MALGKALRAFVALLGCLLLSSCAKGPGGLPYDAWRLGMFVPDYMDAWVETVGVIDIQGRGFPHVLSGVPSSIHPDSTEGDATGWPGRPGWGAGKYIPGAALPLMIIVRWQSLAEPQTYEALIPIPETTRQQMKVRERNTCTTTGIGKPVDGYRRAITIGLAPGGIVKAWVTGVCVTPIEITRVQAHIKALGPDQGRSGGQYALPLMPNSKAYIEKNGIPYGSW
ncbi:DUF2931 family protein [Pseudomonas sp. NPDC007930]|uniref:DUF2931 family protein n=1 Tax=Pseudomonas sp. NPDC007930 TaxID=3364417 RepID=UPI0036EAD5A6